MRLRQLASLAGMLWMLTVAAATAQLVPKAAPTSPVESAELSAPGDPYPGAAWPILPLPPAVDQARMMTAITAAFATSDPMPTPGTRALVIINHGALVYERYSDGFGPDSRFAGGSLAKALVNAGIGILVGDGRLTLLSRSGVAQWSKDSRHDINVRELLTMTSGLAWPDAPGVPAANAAEVQMLFGRGRNDMAAFAAHTRLAHEPGQVFQYSSGSTAILASMLAGLVGPETNDALARRAVVKAFYEQRLFAPLGIKSAVIEFDRRGTLNSSGVHMTAQDFARLGYLYLRDGGWGAKPVLPAHWVEFTATPNGAQNSAAYGAHFWLMTRKAGDEAPPPTLEDDPQALLETGIGGQVILIVPSRALVIVRLGATPNTAWPAIHSFLREVVSCFPET